MSQDVGGSVVQEVASLEANGGRTTDQRMMVNGVALSDERYWPLYEAANDLETVFHIHLHVLGGRRLSWPPG